MKFAVVAVLASAVNPRQIRDHARATGQLAKTGALDARTLAKFAAAVRPEVRPLPDTQTRALDEAVTRRRPLVEMAGAERTLDATARRRSPTRERRERVRENHTGRNGREDQPAGGALESIRSGRPSRSAASAAIRRQLNWTRKRRARG